MWAMTNFLKSLVPITAEPESLDCEESQPSPEQIHPPTADMVVEALFSLHDRHGSSLKDIKSYISNTFDVEMNKIGHLVKRFLKTKEESGVLLRMGGEGMIGKFKLHPDVLKAVPKGARDDVVKILKLQIKEWRRNEIKSKGVQRSKTAVRSKSVKLKNAVTRNMRPRVQNLVTKEKDIQIQTFRNLSSVGRKSKNQDGISLAPKVKKVNNRIIDKTRQKNVMSKSKTKMNLVGTNSKPVKSGKSTTKVRTLRLVRKNVANHEKAKYGDSTVDGVKSQHEKSTRMQLSSSCSSKNSHRNQLFTQSITSIIRRRISSAQRKVLNLKDELERILQQNPGNDYTAPSYARLGKKRMLDSESADEETMNRTKKRNVNKCNDEKQSPLRNLARVVKRKSIREVTKARRDTKTKSNNKVNPKKVRIAKQIPPKIDKKKNDKKRRDQVRSASNATNVKKLCKKISRKRKIANPKKILKSGKNCARKGADNSRIARNTDRDIAAMEQQQSISIATGVEGASGDHGNGMPNLSRVDRQQMMTYRNRKVRFPTLTLKNKVCQYQDTEAISRELAGMPGPVLHSLQNMPPEIENHNGFSNVQGRQAIVENARTECNKLKNKVNKNAPKGVTRGARREGNILESRNAKRRVAYNTRNAAKRVMEAQAKNLDDSGGDHHPVINRTTKRNVKIAKVKTAKAERKLRKTPERRAKKLDVSGNDQHFVKTRRMTRIENALKAKTVNAKSKSRRPPEQQVKNGRLENGDGQSLVKNKTGNVTGEKNLQRQLRTCMKAKTTSTAELEDARTKNAERHKY